MSHSVRGKAAMLLLSASVFGGLTTIFKADGWVGMAWGQGAIAVPAGIAPFSDATHDPQTSQRPPRRTLADLSGYAQGVAEGVAQDSGLATFYAARDFNPIWTGAEDATRRAALFAALDSAGVQGLPSARYKADDLRAAFNTLRSERERGLLEARMARTFALYARDVSSGMLTPKRIDPTIVRDIRRPDSGAMMQGFASADSPDAYLRALVPQTPEYGALLRARIDLGRQIAAGGWGRKVDASALAPGANGPQVVALRARLAAMGYGAGQGADYDATLKRAVHSFQNDMALTADGVAGPATLAAINTAPEDRLKSVIVAMERLRWMNGVDLSQRLVWVNIPDFSVQILEDGKPVYTSRTVVGKADPEYRTPEFSDSLRQLVINPSWHVPRSITVNEYLPKMQKDRNAAPQIIILDKNGDEVPRDTINFADYTPDSFPYRMRQLPSDDNALGVVKFLFPNPWNIYLHDTPSKSYFNRDVRMFSHGCVRVAKPLDLAYQLLAPQVDDPVAVFQNYLDAGKEKTIALSHPLPVHLVYFTAWPDADGRIAYRNDVYGRDAALFDALEKAGVELPVLTN